MTPPSDSIEALEKTLRQGIEERIPSGWCQMYLAALTALADRVREAESRGDLATHNLIRAEAAERERDELRVLIGPVNMVAVDSMLDRAEAAEAEAKALREALVRHHEISYRPIWGERCPICTSMLLAASESSDG